MSLLASALTDELNYSDEWDTYFGGTAIMGAETGVGTLVESQGGRGLAFW